eukprot:30845-Pelagococcus_subviridis.AAC.3
MRRSSAAISLSLTLPVLFMNPSTSSRTIAVIVTTSGAGALGAINLASMRFASVSASAFFIVSMDDLVVFGSSSACGDEGRSGAVGGWDGEVRIWGKDGKKRVESSPN